jgi:type IV pilus assembly protein PilV
MRSPAPRGFSLIEVMVALVVVSLGLGGVLMSQAQGFAASNGAGHRVQAAVLAEHLLDRARANPAQSYVVGEGAPIQGSTPAQRDLYAWKTQLARSLPDGDGRVTAETVTDTGSGRDFERLTIVVGWDDRRSGAGDTGTVQRRHLLIQGFRAVP